MVSTGDKDINDIFDDLVFAQDKHISKGYEEGFKQGSIEGNPDAYHIGYHRGAELGSEIGYYSGIVETFLTQPTNTERVLKDLKKLKSLIDEFPRTNSEDVDIFGAADNIRTLFRKVCSLTKIDCAYPEADNLSF